MNARADREAVKASVENATFAEWRLLECDRLVIRYEFASRQWSGQVEPYDDLTGKFGDPRDAALSYRREHAFLSAADACE